MEHGRKEYADGDVGIVLKSGRDEYPLICELRLLQAKVLSVRGLVPESEELRVEESARLCAFPDFWVRTPSFIELSVETLICTTPP
ncbi:MAG: hypothetical protein ACYDB2_11240 [Acidimicrobiales bacterium]